MTEIIIKTSDPARVPPTPPPDSSPGPLPLINLSPLTPHEPAARHKRHTKHPPEQTCHPTLPRRALTGLDLLPHRVDFFGKLVLRDCWRGRWWRYCRRGQSGAGGGVGDSGCGGDGGGGDCACLQGCGDLKERQQREKNGGDGSHGLANKSA